jgi:hypothetical protein
MGIVDVCGLSHIGYSLTIFVVVCILQIVGLLLTIVVDEHKHVVASVWLSMTLFHGLFVFVSACILLHDIIYKYGSRIFEIFSFFRTITSVIMMLTFTIFYMQIATKSAAFDVPKDCKTDSMMDRFEFLFACIYAAIAILSSVGYGDFIPIQWYSRLVVLPNFLFTFLSSCFIFTAFTEYNKRELRKHAEICKVDYAL